MIEDYRYHQFHDYLSQLIYCSKKNNYNITSRTIAKKLDVDNTNIYKFLNFDIKKPKKALSNFRISYPMEYQRWPTNSLTIQRILQQSDVVYFLYNSSQMAATPHLTSFNGAPTPLNQPSELFSMRNPTHRTTHEHSMGNIYINNSVINVYDQVTQRVTPWHNPGSMGGSFDEINALLGRLAAITLEPRSPALHNLSQLPTRPTTLPPTTTHQTYITISYRGSQSEQDGKAMVYDHMLVQNITSMATAILLPVNQQLADDALSLLKTALKAHPTLLPLGENKRGYNLPFRCQDISSLGLLIIPGRARKVEDEPQRLTHEYRVIREALNRGQPILALCGGSWRLWEMLLIWTHHPDYLQTPAQGWNNWHKREHTLIDLQDHNYGGGTLRLDTTGRRAINNVQIHDIEIEANSLISDCFNNDQRTTVNSVHWKAVNPDYMPLNVRITARSRTNPTIAIMNRHQQTYHPTENSVEAFETIQGTPTLGIQWHPEGYSMDSSHGQIFKKMALAGQAFAAKRAMLAEFKSKVQS